MKVTVVGAGISGLLCAHRLRDGGLDVQVLEQTSIAGGRLATTRFGGAVFDTGAQFFTVRSPLFQSCVDSWIADGVVREWCRGFGPDPDGFPRYIGVEGMAGIADALVPGLDVRFGFAVGDVDALDADAVVMTAPGDAYDPMLAVLCVLDRPSAVPAPGGVQLADDPVFSFVGDNQAKGISPLPALTLHVRAGRMAALDEVLAAAAPFIGSANVVDAHVLHWRHGRPMAVTGPECVVTDAPRLTVLAGDHYGGMPSRVEGAALSGLAAADEVLARLLG